MSMKSRYLAILYLNCAIFLSALSAERIYVNKSAPSGGDGTSWENAFQFIHDALNFTESGRGDEVWIAKGTYYPDEGSGITNNETTDANAFYLKDAVSIYGGFSGVETNINERDLSLNKTIISGSVSTNEDLTSVPADIYNLNSPSIYSRLYSDVIFLYDRDLTLDGLVIKNAFSEYNNIFRRNSSDTAIVQVRNCDFLYIYSISGNLFGSATSGTYKNCNFSFINLGTLFDFETKATDCVFNNNTFLYSLSYMENIASDFTNCVFAYNNADSLFSGSGSGQSVNTTNCIFYSNLVQSSIFNSIRTVNITNCTFSENAVNGTRLIDNSGDPFVVSLRNSIIDQSVSDITGDLFNFASNLQVPQLSFGDLGSSSLRATNLITGVNVAQFEERFDFGFGFLISTDPMFVDPSNVKGPDNIWGTADDGLRLQSTSPAIDAVGNNSLPFDAHDLDQDGDTTEVLSLDIAGNMRNQGNAMDLGAYEFNEIEIGLYTLISSAAIGGSVNPSGVTVFYNNDSVALEAAANSGYLFSSWSGDIVATDNPTTLVMNSNKTVVANFIQDDSDSDGDGLSNYAESVVYGSDPNQIDTSGDGFNDKSIVDAGFDPTQNYQGLITFLDYYSLDDIEDLRSGSVLLSNGPDNLAKLRLQIERTEDLINWTAKPEDIFEIEIPLSEDKEFYRFAFPQE